MPLRKLQVSTPIRTLGCIAVAFPPVWFFVGGLIHVFASARVKAHEANCSTNVKQILTGMLQYAQDWDDSLPPSKQ